MTQRGNDSVAIEMLDVLIVGAGLSGIGAAHHLQRLCPHKTYAILDKRQAIGGTWDLFRYPGIRSDSDMYTLGYRFKPWTNPKAIADGPAILAYVQETAHEAGIVPHIRFGWRVRSADWSSDQACWSVVAERVAGTDRDPQPVTGPDGSVETMRVQARFLYLCSGYYSYSQPHRPRFDGEDEFKGTLVEPQFWPQGLDHAGKQVVVIGSGATAVTVVPEMARTAAHVTMLQRSPSYVVSRPSRDEIGLALARWLPAGLAYALTRWKNVLLGIFFYQLARRRPEPFKRRLIGMVRQELGRDYDTRTHFTPAYKPWDQRVCAVPDGDLFERIRAGRASVVTDHIDRFTSSGVRLVSGKELPADIIVIATGLQLNVLGEMALHIDGQALDASQTMAYKGMMLSGVPNFAMTFGYTNSSWTLKADLTAAYVCRLLRYMDRKGHHVAMPVRSPDVQEQPFLNFSSGYVQRDLHRLPRQGAQTPWRLYQNYVLDLLTLRYSRIDDGVMRFT